MGTEYVSTTEAAVILNVTRQRVLQLINEGRLRATRLGNTYMILRTDIAVLGERPVGRPSKKKILTG